MGAKVLLLRPGRTWQVKVRLPWEPRLPGWMTPALVQKLLAGREGQLHISVREPAAPLLFLICAFKDYKEEENGGEGKS